MPKSSSAVRPSGSTNRFPPWRSPWKMPWIMAPSMNADHARCARRRSVSMPAACIASTSSNLKPVEPLHHQHAARDERGVRAGDDVAALAEVGQHPGDVEHVLGLEAEVELLGDRLGEQLDEGGRVGQRGDRDAPDEVRGEPRHRPQVLAHERVDGRSLHLHHDGLTRAQRGRVHLGDGRRGERLAVEPLERGLERAVRGRPRRLRARPRTARPAPGRGTA